MVCNLVEGTEEPHAGELVKRAPWSRKVGASTFASTEYSRDRESKALGAGYRAKTSGWEPPWGHKAQFAECEDDL